MILKCGDKWRVEICKNGIRWSKTCATKSEAILWGTEEDKKLTFKLKDYNPIHFFSDVIKRYVNEISVTKHGEKHKFIH